MIGLKIIGQQGCTSNASAGEQFIYEFIPTSIMEVQTVRCMCCGDKYTYYDD